MEQNGKAYGFFYCRAPKQEIEEWIPTLRETALIPSQLELTLVEGAENLKDAQKPAVRAADLELRKIVQMAKGANLNYALDARFPGASNQAAAKELTELLHMAYQSPLYEQGEEFLYEVVYEEGGRFIRV